MTGLVADTETVAHGKPSTNGSPSRQIVPQAAVDPPNSSKVPAEPKSDEKSSGAGIWSRVAMAVQEASPAVSETALVFPITGLLVSSFAFWCMYELVRFGKDSGRVGLGAVVAVSIGIVVGGLAWLVAALLVKPWTRSTAANPRVYGQLYAKYDALQTTLDAATLESCTNCDHDTVEHPHCADMIPRCSPCREARRHLTEAGEMLSIGKPEPRKEHRHLPWLAGFAYINVLRRLHRAEEALVLVEGVEDAISGLEDDRLRLQGSAIDSRAEMTKQLDGALMVLKASTLQPPAERAGSEGMHSDATSLAHARTTAVRVRRVINEFRDDRWDSLLQIRSFMIQCSVIAMGASYALSIGGLCGAASVGNPMAPVIITMYFVSGVFIGIFKQIYDASQPRVPALDMFNLLSVQLIIAPVLSGLSSVIGVLIVGLITPSWLDIDTGGHAIQDASILFNFAIYPKGLLVALIAGFAPSFVVGKLSKMAEQIGLDIDRTSVGSGDKISSN